MPRYKITIEYDGSAYSGWQKQNHCPSVQQHIEEAIEKFSRQKVILHAAGRTDSGVHATGQVAHFDLDKIYKIKEVQGAINHFLKPNKIAIVDSEIVDNSFHARFSAKKRYYKYIILNRQAPTVLNLGRAWHIREELNLENMQMASSLLIGQHDFTSFRAVHCQAKSPIKTLDSIDIFRNEDNVIFKFKATSYLHHMVRNIVGTLVQVGLKRWKPEYIVEVMKAKDRCRAALTAPASGLYFIKVDY